MIREQNKKQLLSKVILEANFLNQRTIEAVSGEPEFFEIEANNPFDKTQTLQI